MKPVQSERVSPPRAMIREAPSRGDAGPFRHESGSAEITPWKRRPRSELRATSRFVDTPPAQAYYPVGSPLASRSDYREQVPRLMSSPAADGLQSLLVAPDPEARDAAWSAFLEEHSRLILHVARSLSRDDDAVMDRYAFVIAALRADDFRRLRAYLADGRGKFTTWLIVVVRRLCYDHHRHRYGRRQADSERTGERLRERRQLTDLVGGELGLNTLETAPEEGPDQALCRRDLRTALGQALAGLEPADRLLLRYRFEDQLSVPEIARLLGEASPFRLYRRLDRLLLGMRRALQSVGIHDSVP